MPKKTKKPFPLCSRCKKIEPDAHRLEGIRLEFDGGKTITDLGLLCPDCFRVIRIVVREAMEHGTGLSFDPLLKHIKVGANG